MWSRGQSLLVLLLITGTENFVTRPTLARQSLSILFSSNFMDDELLDELVAVAMEASKKAGAIILGNAGGVEVSKLKANSRDLLTQIDPLCEATIRETILGRFPSDSFLGEEDVPPGKEASAKALDDILRKTQEEVLWIVEYV